MGRKITIYLVLCFMCIFKCVGTVQAEEIITYSEGFYKYHLGQGYVSVCEYFGNQEKVKIPSSMAGRPVVIIENNTFRKTSKIKEIHIPDTVTYIEEDVFTGMKYLTKIVTDTVDLKIIADEGVEIEYLRSEPSSGDVGISQQKTLEIAEATAKDNSTGTSIENIKDKDRETYWSGSLLKAEGETEENTWFSMDLGDKSYLIDGISLNYYLCMRPTEYEIQISNDEGEEKEWVTVDGARTLESGSDNDLQQTITFDIPISARYIRIYVTKINENAQKNMLAIREVVLQGREIQSVANVTAIVDTPEEISLWRGNKLDILRTNSDKKVKVAIDYVVEEQTVIVPVSWDTENFDTDIAGTYTLNGTLRLNGLHNDNQLTLQQKIIVKENTVLAAACTDTLTPLEVILAGGGNYAVGQSVRLTAPVLPGKTFIGWYQGTVQVNKDNSITVIEIGDRVSGKTAYSIEAEEGNTSYVAVYEEVQSSTIVSLGEGVEGVTYSITAKADGSTTEEKSYTQPITCQLGDVITLRAAEDCVGWKNVYGVYLTRKNVYTFTVSGEVEGLTPVFYKVSDKKLVVFESYYKQELDRTEVSSQAEIDAYAVPELPARYGYTAIGWRIADMVGTNYGIVSQTMIKDTLKQLLQNGVSVTMLTAEYVADESKICNVTVKNGEAAEGEVYRYKLSEIVRVKAEKVEGKQFSHWIDANGNIMSYNAAYSFYAIADMTLEAVYVTDESELETPVGITEILYSTVVTEEDTEMENLKIVSLSTVPSGYTIHKAGVIVALKDKLNGQELTDKTAQRIAGDAWSGTTYRYTYNIRKGADMVVCARAYLVYSDMQGNIYTVYGDVFEM